jgi:hypothetical protein
VRLPTTVWGTQDDGTVFVEQARTVDISPTGACLAGLVHPVAPGTILGLRHGCASGRFRVVWVGAPGTKKAGQVGVTCIEVGQTVVRTLLYISEKEYGLDRHRRTLEGAGYALVALGAADTLDTVSQAVFDAAIVEHPLNGSDMDGLTAGLRERNSRAPLILLSSHPGSVSETALRRVDALLHKGVRAQELLAKVEELVGPGTQLRWPITRSSRRYPVAAEVTVRLVRHGQAQVVQGRTLDMSEDGAGIRATTDMLPGEIVSLSFKQAALSQELCLYGTVRQRAGDEYGIEFLDLSAAQLDGIRRLCEGLPPWTSPRI